jgi:microcystin-dependent protein
MTAYVGEIRQFAGNFAPAGWMFCQGQTLAISENDVLFQLIGTTYGGDGQSTFNLPNLASRVPIHMGTGGGSTYQIGEMAGTEQVTLSVQQIPIHTHPPLASASAASATSPAGNVLALPSAPATVVNPMLFGVDPPATALHPSSILPQGGSQPHENVQPYLCINYIISLFGVFPSQT